MRHRRKGRVLGRSPSHQRALLRNLASALMLTEREAEAGEAGAPKVAGRIITTLAKAKEVRPLVERCVTIAKRGLAADGEAREFASTADRGSAAWKQWRESETWSKWARAAAPGVKARRRVVQLLGDKQAARIRRVIDSDGIDTVDGVVVRIAPALCPPDDWHAQEGWIGSRQAMETFFYDAGRFAGMLVADGKSAP